MMNISAQDFRNAYVKFYAAMRNYLWPYDILEHLANLEVNLYTTFIDVPVLVSWLDRIWADIREVCKDDKKLEDAYNDMRAILGDDISDINIYATLPKVQEVEPEKNKILKTVEEDEINENYEEAAN